MSGPIFKANGMMKIFQLCVQLIMVLGWGPMCLMVLVSLMVSLLIYVLIVTE
jgi:hypothetical protein